MAIVAGPDIGQIRSRQTAYKLKSDIRYAQGYEIASRRRTRIAFDTSSESYSVYYESTPDSDTWTLMANPLTQSDFTVELATAGLSQVDIVQSDFEGEGNIAIFR